MASTIAPDNVEDGNERCGEEFGCVNDVGSRRGGLGHLFRVDGAHSLRVWWSSQGQSGPPDHTPLPNSREVLWLDGTSRGGGGADARRAARRSTRPSPNGRRVGIRIVTFEACSGFTRVTARRIAQSPKGGLCHEAPARPVARPSRSSATGSIDNSPGGIFLH
jgi:hypothetical protein